MKTICKLPDGGRLDLRKPAHAEFIASLRREMRLEEDRLRSIAQFRQRAEEGTAMNFSSQASSAAIGTYTYAVDRTRSVEDVEGIINKRTSQGWEFVTAYASTGGVGANFGTNMLIFRKKA